MSAPGSLTIERVSKSYGATAAVAHADLAVPAGSFVVLLGPSGSGKTTLLAMIAGFTTPTAGRILIGGEDVTFLAPAKRPTATVFQDYALFPHLSVADNVAFGLSVRGVAAEARQAAAAAMLERVGLAGFGARRIDQLSGGQRQRVALARALVVEPAVLLLDEPLGALDLSLRRQMQDELKGLQRTSGRTFVHVTHDQEEAMALADVVVVMNSGAIEDAGPPRRLYERPATRFTATFMGESSIVEGRVEGPAGAGRIAVATPLGPLVAAGGLAAGSAAALAIRPERFRIAGEAGTQPLGRFTVREAIYQGSFVRLRAVSRTAPAVEVLAKLPPEAACEAGAAIELAVAPQDVTALAG